MHFFFVICVDQEGDADWCFCATLAGAAEAANQKNETAFDDAKIYKVTLPGLDVIETAYEKVEAA